MRLRLPSLRGVPRIPATAVGLIAVAGALACGGDPQERGTRIVTAALDRMGGADLLPRTGGVGFDATGWYDKTAERQGWSMTAESRGSFTERLAVGGAGDTVGYEYREERFDGTSEELREIYAGQDRRLIVILSAGFAVDLRSPEHAEARRKLLRRFPALLLAELLEDPAGLRHEATEGDTLRVAGQLDDGTGVTLRFTETDTLLRRVSYQMDFLSFGDTEVSWTYDDYRDVEDVGSVPHRYGVRIGPRAMTSMTVDRVVAGPGAVRPYLDIPEDVEVGEPQDVGAQEDASAGARVDTLGDGFYRVVNLRGGFHPLFVRMGDALVAVDAPAGYPLPNELPAGDVAPGPSSDWLSQRYLDLMEAAAPGLPVSHMVLTHFHNDHGGGLRAFVAEGATVVASAADTAEVRAYVDAPHTLAPDQLAGDPRPLRMEAVDGRWTLEAGGRTLEVLEVGPNPHTQGMLVVRLPVEGVMFVSDLLDPTRDPARFPKPEHARLDRWFGAWLDEAALMPERIYTMHGSGLVTPDHLARLRNRAGGSDGPGG